MEWQQLEYFRVVAKQEHFRKSAEQLNISQPALSRSIAKLEEELGVPLFDRSGRSVELNKFGHHFLIRVENALNEISMGVEEINHLKNPYTGTVSLAFLPTLGLTILPDIISHFNNMYPDVEIQLFQSKTTANIQQLLNREVDLCLIGPISHHPEIEWHPLLKEELFVYVPAGHRLATKSSIHLSEIKEDPFISFKRGLGMREITDHLFEEAGFTPAIKFEGEDVSTLAGLVSSGLGVTIIPAFHGISSDKIKQLSISESKCFREIGIAWLKRSTLSPSAALFRSYVIDCHSS
ncbi:DNA-binding transcriptional LysR family regulator [Bacillus oleivorans]|uniref:DNA-binding transcriptional LysR family regulator n=1 Tax=Bacillus oleivorans TaxID=1448271 RepID=A0A285D711_9BACI|nr:LysR family transcriptional regulator [Bacillus oleivorans]SNX75599.1 DNA-binding transcriptional LysR family regulator [Bacillus oleivorans]